MGASGTGDLLKSKIDGTLCLYPIAKRDIHPEVTVTSCGVVARLPAPGI